MLTIKQKMVKKFNFVLDLTLRQVYTEACKEVNTMDANENQMQVSLRAARINAGLTVDDAAKAVSKHRNTILRWESGKTEIPSKDFRKLCDLYQAPMSCIFLP